MGRGRGESCDEVMVTLRTFSNKRYGKEGRGERVARVEVIRESCDDVVVALSVTDNF
jgi:hypothetical protein